MDITINKTSDCQATLNATASADEVKAIQDSITATYTKNVRLPGFRPGKAPKSVVLKRYANEISSELAYRMQSDIQEKALNDNPQLKVLDFGTPEASVQEDGTYAFTSTLTVIPEFELPEYMGLEVSVDSTEVTDAEVEETLQKYAETAAEHVPAERASQKGDIVVIDFKTSIDGKPTAEALGKDAGSIGFLEGRDGHWVSLDDDKFIPALAEGLVGVSAGEQKDILAHMQDDFLITELAGKDLTFHCTIKEVREKKVPEINESLFEHMLPGKSMEEIRSVVREQLKGSKERQNDEAKADQISEQLADKLTFSLPAELVQRENENTAMRKAQEMMQAGDYAALNDMDALRESCKPETERNLRVYFALQEIADREKIVVTDQELLSALANMAQQAREKNFKAFIRKMKRENRIMGVRLSIITSKVLDLLARNAKVNVKEA